MTPSSQGDRSYLRDPDHQAGKRRPGYLATATLPPTAIDTGLRQDGKGLWLEPNDERFAWLVSEHGVEWLARGGIVCA